MARVIRTMNAQQIEEAANQLYFPKSKADAKSSSDAQKYLAWVSFRDAVAQAGTGPALIAINKWIQENKVQGDTAAQLFAALPNTARYPTEEYLKALFELVRSHNVIKQESLITSAVLAFTSLIRMAHVNSDTAHNRFPVHSFGRPISGKAQKTIYNEYIPYLATQLRNAVKQGDSRKIQTYIYSLGNTAHPRILSIFEPYLEGKEDMSNFQRLVIIASMDQMTQINPKLVRPILYKLYSNTGETSEIRVAAVMQLMKTNPPAEMLQRMAQFTNNEHNKQVNSAVKSAIESAAKLTGPHHEELARNAKSAVNLLTPYQYGFQYSKNYLNSYISEQQKISYKITMTSIQSQDSIIPSTFFYTLRKTLGGLYLPRNINSLMTSSANNLMDLLSNQFEKTKGLRSSGNNGPTSTKNSPWTTDKIAKMLNIEVDNADQVEGNFLFSSTSGKRLFAFDNHTIEQLPFLVKMVAKSLQNGQHFNHTKMFNQYVIKIGFPTAMGLPFMFSLQVPTLLSAGGEIQLKSHPDLASSTGNKIRPLQTMNMTAEIKMIYASKVQSKLGFVTPFNHQRYLAGYDRNVQLQLPLRVKLDVDVENTKIWSDLQPLHPNQYQKIAEYSTMAYTTRHDILDLSPPQLDNGAQIIHVRPVERFEVTGGQGNTGFAFDLKGETEQDLTDVAYFMKKAQSQSLFSTFSSWCNGEVINPNTNYTVSFNPHKTTANSVKITANYEERKNSKTQDLGENQNGAIPSNSELDNQERIKQFLERAASGIQDAYSQAVDVSIDFNGNSNVHYVATGALSRSPVSQKSRYLLFLSKNPIKSTQESKPYQVAVDVTSKAPNVPLIHYRKAFEANPSSYIKAQFNFGEKAESGGEIKMMTELKQTRTYKEILEQVPMAVACERQMLQGNNILPECRNMTARANYLDQYMLTTEFHKVPDVIKNLTYKAYSVVRQMAYPYISENIINHENPSGKIALNVNFAPDLQSANVSLDTPSLSSEFTHLRVGPLTRALTVIHPEYDAIERLEQWGLLSQQHPTCVIDKNFATTLDNKTYPIHIGKCWHVMIQSTPRPYYEDTRKSNFYDEYEAVSILVRDVESNQREYMIVLGEDVINLQPYSGSAADYFIANDQKYKVSKESMGHFEDKYGTTIVQAYKLPTGVLRVHAPRHGFELLYDGLRVKLYAPNGRRDEIRGLCGTFDGEKANDFTTPKNCVLKNPSEFAATYAITDESCQGPAKELNLKSQNSPCYKQIVIRTDAISNPAISKPSKIKEQNLQPKYKKSGVNKVENNLECEVYRSKIIDRNGMKCFSKKPLLNCFGTCNKSPVKAQKTVEFFCMKDSPAAARIAGMVNMGLQPNFTKKQTHITETVSIPTSCSQA